MRKTILLAIIACSCFLSACGKDVEKINKLKRPIMVVSQGEKGSTLLMGSDGQFILVPWDTYLGASLKNAPVGVELGTQFKGYSYPSKLITCRKCGAETVVNGEACR